MSVAVPLWPSRARNVRELGVELHRLMRGVGEPGRDEPTGDDTGAAGGLPRLRRDPGGLPEPFLRERRTVRRPEQRRLRGRERTRARRPRRLQLVEPGLRAACRSCACVNFDDANPASVVAAPDVPSLPPP
jgi:hypothetical protein